DDLDHMSGFTINSTNYSIDDPDGFFSFREVEETEEEEISEEEKEKELRELVDEIVSEFADISASYSDSPSNPTPLLTEWIAEIKKPRSVDELVDFLKSEQAKNIKEEKSMLKYEPDIPLEERRKRYFAMLYQKMVVKTLLEAVEDRSMDV